MTWRSFCKTVLLGVLGIASAVYGAIVLIDPYDSLAISLPVERAPVVTNQRFSFPALARETKFDSAVIGTSTTRLLRPSELDETLGGSFVNLSMNSATAWEQSQIFALFLRHHPRPRTVIFGIDSIWCTIETEYQKLTPRPFPAWLYDENQWNDLLHIFDLKTIEQAGLQLAFIVGLQPARRGLDGYTDFLPPRSEYDLARARGHIYGQAEPIERGPVEPPYRPTDEERLGWVYATHDLLADMLRGLPQETLKIFLFVPYHRYHQPAPGSLQAAQWQECKRRIVDMAGNAENAHVLDFMIDSRITRDDANYWDGQHYDVSIATRIGHLIAEGVAERRGQPDLFRYLNTARSPD